MWPPFKAWHGPDRLPSGCSVPPAKHGPLCDHLRLPVTQELVHRLYSQHLFWVVSWQISDDHLNFIFDQKKQQKTTHQANWKIQGLRNHFPDGFYLTSPWWLALKERCWRIILCCFSFIWLISNVGCPFIQKECAKLGSAIMSAHLWASWTKIVHFPSESICRPIIGIILGTPEYPVVTASSAESTSQSHRSCPAPKQLHHSVR